MRTLHRARPRCTIAVALLIAAWSPPTARAGTDHDAAPREFTVMAYNVEMLFDVDGVALIDEYGPEAWGPRQLDRKLDGISRVLQRVNDGRGPDIICFNELEADQTPQSTVRDIADFLREWEGHSAHELLTAPRLDPRLAGAPVEAWLAKRLADDGLGTYEVAVGRWRPDPTGRVVFHTNAVFSRFPIIAARTHPTEGARGILEVELEVAGQHLYVFNNHWKSGASDPETEPVRIGNARVLRRRLDAILRADPHADVILAGDFNSHYNQRQRHPSMRRTAINDVLGSQGDETALTRNGGAALYNLWFELPHEQRGSDEYRGEWGTLIQILVTRGLYDARGVQYIDNSFQVAAFPGLNAYRDTGRPIRWTFADGGAGYSDHFPILARFRAGETLPPVRLAAPSRTPEGPAEAVPVTLGLDRAVPLHTWPRNREFRSAENIGRFFRVRGRVTETHPFRVRVEGPDVEIDVWIHDRAAREAFFRDYAVGDPISFVGELGQYRRAWQFVIPESTIGKQPLQRSGPRSPRSPRSPRASRATAHGD